MNKLTFKVLGSGYQVIWLTTDLPEPFIGVHFGMIDRQVDGIFYWCPDKEAIAKGSVFPAWVLRGIADEIDRLNEWVKEEVPREELLQHYYNETRIKRERLLEELNAQAMLRREAAVKQLKTVYDVAGQKPYTMEELNTQRGPRLTQERLDS